MNTKICRVCEEKKPISKFYKAKTNKDGYMNTCILCWYQKTVLYRKKNREKYNSWCNKYRKKHLKKYARLKRGHRKRQRDWAFEIIANGKPIRCSKHEEWNCCGDPYELDYLTLDHIDGDGFRHRKEYTKDTGLWQGAADIYAWVKKNPEIARKKLQIVCMNANMMKAKRNMEYRKR